MCLTAPIAALAAIPIATVIGAAGGTTGAFLGAHAAPRPCTCPPGTIGCDCGFPWVDRHPYAVAAGWWAGAGLLVVTFVLTLSGALDVCLPLDTSLTVGAWAGVAGGVIVAAVAGLYLFDEYRCDVRNLPPASRPPRLPAAAVEPPVFTHADAYWLAQFGIDAHTGGDQ